MSELNKGHKVFKRFAMASFVTVFLLILVGTTVRITGSGMGCPDWPTCFGRIVPPTDVSQLPANYQEIYADRGYDTMEFNAIKTWIEYINRLFSSLVGFAVLGMVITSFRLRKQDVLFPILSLSTLFLVGFEAWLGKTVVESNLLQAKISTHLFGAMVILALVTFILVRLQEREPRERKAPGFRNLILGLVFVNIAMLIIQIVMGTYVRGEVDGIAQGLGEGARENWISFANEYLPTHRLLSIGVSIPLLALMFCLMKAAHADRRYKTAAVGLGIALAGQIMTGIFLNDFGFPAVSQLLHLGFAMAMFALLVFVLTVHIYNLSHVDVKDGKKVQFA